MTSGGGSQSVLTPSPTRNSLRHRRRIVVTGVVQGVGFRPFVYTRASRHGLSGWVRNDASGVVVEVEGDLDALAAFVTALHDETPPLAVVETVDVTEVPAEGGTGFAIGSTDSAGSVRTLASPDIAMCADCEAELTDPDDRRYRHPFITCTNCGPRFTIITGLPYDRPTTTMARFAMCDPCAAEYADPADRRFHAQTIACPDCGPRIELVDVNGAGCSGEDALAGARADLTAGRIVAVKGIGGYHLACDATNPDAVAELRRRKRRGAKPFAVMVPDLETARLLVEVSETAADLLTGIRRPVVVLPRRTDMGSTVCDAVAPGNPDLGILLPYTPLHLLLFGLSDDKAGPPALVMTSGNLSGEPIVVDDDAAMVRLGSLADAWLRHDRPIHVPCDDSVTRVFGGHEIPIRRSRGYAPLPLALPFEVTATLAAGADLKNTCAVAAGRYAWLSQHVGDMDDVATIDALTATRAHLETLTGVRPDQVVADAHPTYRSTTWARDTAGDRPFRTVQHHHAHITAVMGEHGLDGSSPVIGFAFDGTGYGTDGAVWGGEVLLADYRGFRRLAHLAYTPLPGGDISVRRPYRMALAHLYAAGVAWDDEIPSVAACPDDERRVLLHQLETGLGTVPTSSMGRLFDAVASLAEVRHVADFEAEAAIELEALARGIAVDRPRYVFGLQDPATPEAQLFEIDAAPVVRAVVADVCAGVDPSAIAAAFHSSVVDLVAEVARRAQAEYGQLPIVLGGGVFQNGVLLSGVLARLGDGVLWPRQLPANDGGLALGQILISASG